ncbi:MAG TPA: hypothetical protein DEG88_06510 [Propionibacteriaceae bacterium]|nr:hypothetical protein [Propionibacteriaceae bacterium]HBY22934.1 hypothetical protein [Propionibacteriaceae bacterium]
MCTVADGLALGVEVEVVRAVGAAAAGACPVVTLAAVVVRAVTWRDNVLADGVGLGRAGVAVTVTWTVVTHDSFTWTAGGAHAARVVVVMVGCGGVTTGAGSTRSEAAA